MSCNAQSVTRQKSRERPNQFYTIFRLPVNGSRCLRAPAVWSPLCSVDGFSRFCKSRQRPTMSTTTSNGRAAAPVTPEPVTLYGANDKPLSLADLGISDKGAGRRDPFSASFLDGPKHWFATHGPALAGILLIGGSMAATIYNALRTSHGAGIDNPYLVAAVMILAGLVIEAAYGWSWSRQGTLDLAGEQRALAVRMFKLASVVIVGDISLSLAEVAFGMGQGAKYWIGMIQPAAAVYFSWLFFRIKGAHPEHIADLEIVDMRADARAADTRDKADAFKLQLAERQHERAMKWAALDTRQHYAEKLVGSGWFRRRIKRAVKDAVGQKLLGNARAQLGKLPQLLGLSKPQEN